MSIIFDHGEKTSRHFKYWIHCTDRKMIGEKWDYLGSQKIGGTVRTVTKSERMPRIFSDIGFVSVAWIIFYCSI